MRLGVLSDTHDQLERVRRAVTLLADAGAEALVHCGDVTGPEVVVVCATMPMYFVFGNHDSDRVPELRGAAQQTGATCLEWGGMVELAGRRIAVAHGHMTTDIRRLLAEQPDYLLSGHSHLVGERSEGAVRRVNPGALHEADRYSVAMIDLASDAVRFIDVK